RVQNVVVDVGLAAEHPLHRALAVELLPLGRPDETIDQPTVAHGPAPDEEVEVVNTSPRRNLELAIDLGNRGAGVHGTRLHVFHDPDAAATFVSRKDPPRCSWVRPEQIKLLARR